MVIHSFSDILSVLITFLSLFFAFYLLTIRSKNRLSNYLISFFLIIRAIDSGAIITSQLIFPYYPGLGLLINTSLFLSPPLLYFYICSVTNKDFKLSTKYIYHAIPFIVAIVILIPRFYLTNFDDKIEILMASDGKIIEMKLVFLMLHLQIFVYIIASFFVILRSKKLLLENYSFGNINYYNWLFTLIILLVFETIISTFKNVFMLYELHTQYNIAMTLTSLTALFFVCWLVIKALQSPELYGKVDYNQPLVKQLIAKSPQNAVNNIEIKKIEDYMKIEEPYLDPSLSLYDLSKQLEMSSRELSVLINHNLNQHFFDFINEYRIKKAMKLLSDKQNKKLTVLEILYEVGFNSKSSFNTAFKKHTGNTPTQFRKQYIE